MDPSAISDGIKILSAFTSTILGVWGVGGTYKRHGRLTKVGWSVIAGIVVSGVLGSATTLIDESVARNDRNALDQQNTAMLRDIERSMQPLQELSVGYILKTVRGDNLLDTYISDLIASNKRAFDAFANPHLAAATDTLQQFPGVYRAGDDGHGGVALSMDPEVLLKTNPQFAPLYDVLVRPEIELYFYNSQMTPDKLLALGQKFLPMANLAATRATNQGRPAEVTVSRNSDLLTIGESTTFSKERWSSDSSMYSLLDLEGATVFFLVGPFNSSQCGNGEDSSHLSLESVSVNFGTGHSVSISGSHLRKSQLANHCTIYWFTFPKEDKEFEALWGQGPFH